MTWDVKIVVKPKSTTATTMWLTPPGPYRTMNCQERELTLDHIHTFLTTQGHTGPPQISDQLKARATSETTWTWKTMYSIHTPIHSNKANMKGWLWRPNDIRGPCGCKHPSICLTGEEKPRKTSPRKHVPTWDRTQARWVIGTHATACSTAVDDK